MEILSNMIGKEIRVNKGGPDVRQGRLLDVTDNFLVVQTVNDQNEHGVVFMNMQHVKSFTGFIGVHPDVTEEKYGDAPSFYTKADSAEELLNNLVDQLVQVNNGPDKIVGVLMESNEDYLRLIADKEIVVLPLFHVKTLSPIYKKPANQEEDQNNQNAENNNNNNNNNNKNDNKNSSKNDSKNKKK